METEKIESEKVNQSLQLVVAAQSFARKSISPKR
jgi:hypothetical protein